MDLDPTLWRCPHCLSALAWDAAAVSCDGCGRRYRTTAARQPDFRAAEPVTIGIQYRYDPQWGAFPWERVRLEWPTIPLPARLPPGAETIEYRIASMVPAAAPGARSLDLGCGETRQRFKELMRARGYHHVGVDIAGGAPDALADIHLLPFADESVDLLLTHAVYEHVKNPHLAMFEAARVAKDGALFFGSVGFTEPFHISYFHHSPLAVFELLSSAGFEGQTYILSKEWNAFAAQLLMGFAGVRYPALAKRALGALPYYVSLLPAAVKSLLTFSRAPLRLAERNFARSHSASVGFVAVRRRSASESRVTRSARATSGAVAELPRAES